MKRNQGLFATRRARQDSRPTRPGLLRRIFGKVKAKLTGRSSLRPTETATRTPVLRLRTVDKATRTPFAMRKARSRRRNKIAKASRRRNRS